MHHNRIKKSRFNTRFLMKGALTVITAMLLFLFPVNIRASPGSITAKEAAFLYGDELEHAWYSYCGENIFVTIRKYRSSMSEYCLTHVVINDPSQIRSALANDTFGGERERSSDASARLGWVVGINGSNFNWDTGEPQYAGICIKDRQVMKGELTDGREICLSDDGSLFSPSKGLSGEELFAMGVTDSWSCGDTLLIANGEGINYGIQSEQYRYPRTAVGMVRPGEYYLINAGSGNYEGGMTYDEVRNVLLGCGCTFGKCMDGGGSSTLIFRNEVVNTPAEKNAHERAVADFLYFVDEVPDLKTEFGFRTHDETFESGDSVNLAPFPITVDQFLDSCRNVTETARINQYRYGDSSAEDPTTDGIISCDRLIAKALYDLGYTDQKQGGITCVDADEWLAAHGFIRSTSLADAKRGSIMLVKHEGEDSTSHMFVFASDFDLESMTGDRYDCGSQDFIDRPQPVSGVGYWYRTDDVIVYNIP